MANAVEQTALILRPGPETPFVDAQGRFLRQALNGGEFIAETTRLDRAERIISEAYSARGSAPIRGQYTVALETAKVVPGVFDSLFATHRLFATRGPCRIVTDYVGLDYGGYDFLLHNIENSGRLVFRLVTPADLCNVLCDHWRSLGWPHNPLTNPRPYLLLDDQALQKAAEALSREAEALSKGSNS